MKRTLLVLMALLIGAFTAHAQCASGEIEVAVEILTDNFGQETAQAQSRRNAVHGISARRRPSVLRTKHAKV